MICCLQPAKRGLKERHHCERHDSHVCQGHQSVASFRASSIPVVAAYATTRLFSPSASAQRLPVCKYHCPIKHGTALRCAETVLRKGKAAGGLQAPSPNSNSRVRLGAERAGQLLPRQQPLLLLAWLERNSQRGRETAT